MKHTSTLGPLACPSRLKSLLQMNILARGSPAVLGSVVCQASCEPPRTRELGRGRFSGDWCPAEGSLVIYAALTPRQRFSPGGWSFRSRRLELTGAAGFVVAGFSLRGWQGPATALATRPRPERTNPELRARAPVQSTPRRTIGRPYLPPRCCPPKLLACASALAAARFTSPSAGVCTGLFRRRESDGSLLP